MIGVLVVEGESRVAESLVALFRENGIEARSVPSAEEALDAPLGDVVVADLELPGMGGVDLLRRIRQRDPTMPVLLLAGADAIEEAVAAMGLGAHDFLAKPIEPGVILERVRKAAQRRRIERERDRLRGTDKLVAESTAFREALTLAGEAAEQDVTVLLTGESGTGKELVAAFIHDRSPRREGPLVKVNCAAVPSGRFEAEFFGHLEGAHAGEWRDRGGWFAEADGGTLFLDEIGALAPAGQAKLLRALDSGKIRPVGARQTRRVDVRVVAATHDNLVARRNAGDFRHDLYARLARFPIRLPPLRERPEDLRALAERFAAPAELAHAAHRLLDRHRWPGNIRELRQVISRVRVTADNRRIEARDLEPLLPVASEDLRLKTRVNSFERGLFLEALRRSDGRKAEAARLLGIDPSNWAYHAKRLGIAKGNTCLRSAR